MKHKFLFSVFVIFFILVFISLGSWQIIRLNWKNNLILEIETSLKKPPVQLSETNVANFLKIKTSGSIDFDKQIYLYNLNENGTPGFEVINPLMINSKNYLINRGWIPFKKKTLRRFMSLMKVILLEYLDLKEEKIFLNQIMILKKIIGLVWIERIF